MTFWNEKIITNLPTFIRVSSMMVSTFPTSSLAIPSKPIENVVSLVFLSNLYVMRNYTVKGVMPWAKVTSPVCRLWSLPWTKGPNTQLKWKLRYSPIQCAYLRVLSDALLRPSTHQNRPRDRKLTQSCWCLRSFLGLHADVWKIILQVHTRLVVTQDYIEKMFNKNYGNRVSECSFSPLSASVSVIIAKW